MRCSGIVPAILLGCALTQSCAALADEPKIGAPTSAPTAGKPAKASSTSDDPKSSTPTKATVAPAAAEEAEVRYPSWSWSGWVSAAGGYDDNISKSSYAKSGEQQGSGTTALKASIGPTLQISETFSTSLSYGFEHLLYYSNHDLDTQTHSLELGLKRESERLSLSGGYTFSASVLLPKNVFYSLDHDLGLSSEILIKGPFWAGIEYSFHYYDVRDASYAYLGGHAHTGKVYPELYLEGRLTLYGGYQLEIARLGSTVDEVTAAGGGGGGGGAAGVQVESSLSYIGHFGILHAKWTPRKTLSLTLDLKVGRKFYLDALVRGTGAGPGPGGGQGKSVLRTDTLINLDLGASWDFYKGLSLEAAFGFERSTSSMAARFITGSYNNLTGSLGLSWTFF